MFKVHLMRGLDHLIKGPLGERSSQNHYIKGHDHKIKAEGYMFKGQGPSSKGLHTVKGHHIIKDQDLNLNVKVNKSKVRITLSTVKVTQSKFKVICLKLRSLHK